MPLPRAALVCLQTLCYQLASTPPNKTPAKARFDNNLPWYILIATPVFKLQQPLLWLCTLVELLFIAIQASPFAIPEHASRPLQDTFCPHPRIQAPRFSPDIRSTPLTILGALLVACGCFTRLVCFRKLGPFFTFDLTILPSHSLITSGPYSIVRHPAYTGTLLMSAGILLVNFTSGSWVTECGILGHSTAGIVTRSIIALVWLSWWVSVGVQRCRSEDAELRKTFGKEWDKYAENVKCWFVPGIF